MDSPYMTGQEVGLFENHADKKHIIQHPRRPLRRCPRVAQFH